MGDLKKRKLPAWAEPDEDNLLDYEGELLVCFGGADLVHVGSGEPWDYRAICGKLGSNANNIDVSMKRRPVCRDCRKVLAERRAKAAEEKRSE